MRLDSIALNSFLRRWGKTAFLVLGMALALGTVVALYATTGAMNRELADTFDEIGANIMIVPLEETSLAYGGVVLPSPPGENGLKNDDIIAVNTIKNRDNIAHVAPKILGVLPSGKDNLTVVGVDFPEELALKRWWTYEGKDPRAVEEVLVGSRVAEKLKLVLGDTFPLGEGTGKVAAILNPQGTEEDGLVFMNLLEAQKRLGRENRLSFIEVAAYCTTCPLPEIIRQISEKLPYAKVTGLAEAVKARQDVVDRLTGFTYGVSGVVLAIGSLVILLTMISAVRERTREIGIYRAMGYRRRHVFEVIITEALLVGLMGGIIGYAVGILVARALGPGIAGTQLAIGWNPLMGGLTVLAATVLGILAGLYPAFQAARLDPVDALRSL